MLDEKYIPKLVSKYSCIPFKKNEFTICIDNDDRSILLNVHRYTKMFLDQIDGKKNISELTKSFNSANDLKLTEINTKDIITNKLLGYGILEGDNKEKIEIKNNYLKLRFILFSASSVTIIASYFTNLFNEKLFKILFTSAFIFVIASFILFIDLEEFYDIIDLSFLSYSVVINVIAIVLHEFGHAGACQKFGAKNGPIGFGFYIVSPVLYSDVTDIWRLKRKYRIIVDLGGIYIQILIVSLVVIAFFNYTK